MKKAKFDKNKKYIFDCNKARKWIRRNKQKEFNIFIDNTTSYLINNFDGLFQVTIINEKLAIVCNDKREKILVIPQWCRELLGTNRFEN